MTAAQAHESVGAEIITIGDEILRGEVINSNAAIIASALSEIGHPPKHIAVVADRREAIHDALTDALSRSSVVVLSGGLGPTPDDLTMESLATYFDLEVREDAALLGHVESFFRARGISMPPTSRNQARFPLGATQIPNPVGTATGIHIERTGKHVYSLPGVQAEMRLMLQDSVIPSVRAVFPQVRVFTKTLRLADTGESQLLLRLGDLSEIDRMAALAFLPHHGLLDLRITARSSDAHEADMQIATVESRLREVADRNIYAVGTIPLAEVIGKVLHNRSQRLAVAESCTGGGLMQRLTEIPGSSRWFEHGWVTYSNIAKVSDLGVPADIVERCGAVSEETARAMAEKARDKAGADWGVGITGIAGPDGGSEAKPVGTVWIAVSSGHETSSRRFQLAGGRELIRLRTVHGALFMLWRRLLDE